MKTIIPFKLKAIPIKKLALINFEKDPDVVYRSLELQYIDGKPYGTGWRILAGRNDDYLDVYDDNSLTTIENESFDVVGKGLKNYKKTTIKDVRFDKDEYGLHICFSFKDILSRDISVQIHENTKGNSKGMNLLAPIGAGSENPTSLPLFFLYDFDFIRKHKTKVLIEIDGKKKHADNFPFPITKELQWRYYTRYSMDCHMIEFAMAAEDNLSLVELDENHSYTDEQVTYVFNDKVEVSLKSIMVKDEKYRFEMIFDPHMPIERKDDGNIEGVFSVITNPVMGTVNGIYQWKQQNGICIVKLLPDKGWTSVPNSIITKIILSPKSIFCTWPKSYEYVQEIQVDNYMSKSRWINKSVLKEGKRK